MNNLAFNYSNQTAVITGGTRGIGRALSEAFLKAGAHVIAIYGGNSEAAEKFKSEISQKDASLGERLEVVKVDVSSKTDVESFFQDIEGRGLNIDILVNNSGIRRDQLTASMSFEDWQKVLDVNLTGSFLMSQKAVLNMMKNRYGRIINMSSVGGVLGLPGQANYASSKAAQIAMSKVLAKEVAKRGITVNNVLPGFIETELISDLSDEQVKEYKKQVPLKRFGSTDEVAHTVLFLASKEAAYITGAEINLSGGLL